MIKNTIKLFGIGIFLALVACSGVPNTPATQGNPAVTPVTSTSMPYPGSDYPAPPAGPTANPDYPGPGQAQEEIYATPGGVPTSGDVTGMTGIIKIGDKPAVNLSLYLAGVIKDDQGRELVASYDRQNSPRAFTDQDGRFVFTGITPGKYGIVLDTVLSSYLLHDPKTDQPLLTSIEQNKMVDIGEISYDTLPIPGQ